jgi:hypothetical protein
MKIFTIPVGDTISLTRDQILEFVEICEDTETRLKNLETNDTFYFIHGGKIFHSMDQESLLIPTTSVGIELFGFDVFVDCGLDVSYEESLSNIDDIKIVVKNRLQQSLDLCFEISDEKSFSSFVDEKKLCNTLLKYHSVVSKF